MTPEDEEVIVEERRRFSQGLVECIMSTFPELNNPEEAAAELERRIAATRQAEGPQGTSQESDQPDMSEIGQLLERGRQLFGEALARRLALESEGPKTPWDAWTEAKR